MNFRAVKMNYCSRGIISSVFTIIALNAIQSVSGKFEPLYVKQSSPGYEFYIIYDVKYDGNDFANQHQHLAVVHHSRDILIACPRSNNANSLEIQDRVANRARVEPYCELPVKSQVYLNQNEIYFSTIGFLNHIVCDLIYFKFDQTLHRIKTVYYMLGAGEFLKPEINTENKNNKGYEKDRTLFGYDVDDLYYKTSRSLVKVNLAPEEDFLLPNWKSASRRNLLTAPMWKALLPQWQALEIFVRKVTQIINKAFVRTGVYETLTQPGPEGSTRQMFLYNGVHPIPMYFWKAIYIEVRSAPYTYHRHGILFVMHNVDPDSTSEEKSICPDDGDVIAQMGWDFLPKEEFKSPMYACYLNETNLGFFQEKIRPKQHRDPFDLTNVPVEVTDDEGNVIEVKRVHVLDEIKESVSRKFEPLYVTQALPSNAFYIIFNVTYDGYDFAKQHQHLAVIHHSKDILIACPRSNNPYSLEIQDRVAERARVEPYCELPVKSQIFLNQDEIYFSTIGFPIFTPSIPDYPTSYVDVPKNHIVCHLIQFKFDQTLHRIKTVYYMLGLGEFLKPEINAKNKNKGYEKDRTLFGYDVDFLYYKASRSLVKVNLAPEEDFLLPNWKSASRRNLLTAPMWKALLPQWQALEIFVRTVIQIIGKAFVRTGVYETLTQPGPEGSTRQMFLYNGEHPIPMYFWKAIYIEVRSAPHTYHRHGILFVMHNVDPDSTSEEKSICPDDGDVIAQTRWDFFPKEQFKSPMYACYLNKINLKFFQEQILPKQHRDLFDLTKVPVEVTDDEGNVIEVKTVHVLDELKKLQEENKKRYLLLEKL